MSKSTYGLGTWQGRRRTPLGVECARSHAVSLAPSRRSALAYMPFDSLGAFVDALRRRGELVEIGAQVDPYLEISEITDRVVKAGGPALLFTNVRGSEFPVVT